MIQRVGLLATMEINIIIKKEVVLQVTKCDLGQPLSHFTSSVHFEGATGLCPSQRKQPFRVTMESLNGS